MDFSRQKKLFFFLFFSSLLFSFLFSETIYGYVVLLFFSLTFFVGKKAFNFKKNLDKHIVFSILGFLIFSFFSLLASVSFPISLYEFVRYFSLFSLFLFFYSISFNSFDKKFLIKIFFFLGAAFAISSFTLFFFPDISQKIPGLNLLFSTYGHNHLGTLLLLLTPISGYMYIQEKKKMYLFLLVLFYASLMMSFGRVLLLLSIFQILVLLSVVLRNRKTKYEKLVRSILMTILLFGIVAFGIYLFLPRLEKCNSLNIPYKEQICKNSFNSNVRYYYWSQAISSIKESPILGKGVGTFGIISYKFRQIPDSWVRHTHNDFLQIFSESGVFSGLFFISIIFFILRGINSDEKLKKKSLLLLRLSLVSFVVDIFFDFNFHFFSLALSFLILSSLFLRNESKTKNSISFNKIKPFLTMAFTSIILISILNIIVSGLLFFKKDGLAFKIFPYFDKHKINFINSEELSIEEKKFLFSKHSYSPATSEYLLRKLPTSDQAALEFSLWKKDPWRIGKSFLPGYYYNTKDFDGMRKTMSFISKFFEERNIDVGFQKESLDYEAKKEWSKIFLLLAKKDLSEFNMKLSSENIFNAYYFDNWSISHELLLLENLFEGNYSLEQKIEFLETLEEIPVRYWGDNGYLLSRLYHQIIITDSNLYKDPERLEFYVRKMINLDEWSAIFIIEDFSNDNYFRSDIRRSTALFQTVYRVLSISHSDEEYFDRVFFEKRSVYSEKVIQEYFDLLVEEPDKKKILDFVNFLEGNTFGLYWIPAQRGYILMELSSFDEAKKAFNRCLLQYAGNFECKNGLRNINEDSLDYYRYGEVRKIIIDL